MFTSCAIHAWIVPLRSRPILSKIRGHLHDGARFTVLGKPLVMWSQMIHEIRPPQAASSYFRVKLGTVRMPEVSFSRHRHAAKGLLIMGSEWGCAGACKLKTFRVGRKRNQQHPQPHQESHRALRQRGRHGPQLRALSSRGAGPQLRL